MQVLKTMIFQGFQTQHSDLTKTVDQSASFNTSKNIM